MELYVQVDEQHQTEYKQPNYYLKQDSNITKNK